MRGRFVHLNRVAMPAPKSADERYLKLLLTPMYKCAKYKPKFGKMGKAGVSLDQFRVMYGGDPLYHWVGLDSELMYAAHKAAGGMTSIYRQLGIGCERLLQAVIGDELALNAEQVKWEYKYLKSGKEQSDEADEEGEGEGVADDGFEDDDEGEEVGEKGTKLATHTLDARIDIEHITNPEQRERVEKWIASTGKALGHMDSRVKDLRGVVIEVRQGYKSADSKRQNADLRFGVRAYNENYIPMICIVSTQASETVCLRYRNSQILVLRGMHGPVMESTFEFFSSVVGYDLAGFFERNSGAIREEFTTILDKLLSPASE